MALVSPGVEVTVTDESAYGAPGAGTIPLIVVATRENKADPTGSEADGIAKHTKSINAGDVVRVTSQRELSQFFGNPTFETNSNVIVQGSETSEYGLLAAYSYLGQGSQAIIVRADVDLAELESKSGEPVADWSTASTMWIDTNASKFGIHEYVTASGLWVAKTPSVEVNADATAGEVIGTFTPTADVVTGGYLVVIHLDQDGGASLQYFVETTGAWVALTSTSATFSAHYSTPVAPNNADVWVKTTSPGNGISLVASEYTTAWVTTVVQGVTSAVTGGLSTAIGDFVPQDGSSVTALTAGTAVESSLLLDLDTFGILLQRVSVGAPAVLDGLSKYAQNDAPVATAVDGTLWVDTTVGSLDMYVVNAGAYDAVVANIGTTAPTGPVDGQVWVNTSLASFGQANERSYPAINVYSTALTAWVLHDNTDQTTERGVLFADIDDTIAGGSPIVGAPSAAVYPDGMMVVNMAQSKNALRSYDATVGAWRNAVSNHADGSGRFGRHAQRAKVAQAMQAVVAGTELREEQYNFSLMAAPNYVELADELQTLNADRGETAFIILDAPMRLDPTAAVNWVQNTGVASENGEDGLVTNYTYSAVYYPAGQSTEPLNGNTVVVPASHMALYTYAYSDNISFIWFPPAGTTRGVVQNASSVGYLTTENEFKAVALTQGQRDAMYTNKLNPISTFIGQGTVVFGQKSLHPTSSALDRVNVARLVAYLRERFDEIGRPFLFEINDDLTQKRAKVAFDRFLGDILARRGIYDYAVVCDESNNTPARIDRNELWVDIAIEPAKSAEFIYIPIRIVNTNTL